MVISANLHKQLLKSSVPFGMESYSDRSYSRPYGSKVKRSFRSRDKFSLKSNKLIVFKIYSYLQKALIINTFSLGHETPLFWG